jgi:Ca2+/Na+ antiporter
LAFGTNAPETTPSACKQLATTTAATAIGNVIGSNIANVLLDSHDGWLR